MKHSYKAQMIMDGENQLFGIDFHDFIQQQKQANNYELAEEFGLSLKDVKKLKQRMERG